MTHVNRQNIGKFWAVPRKGTKYLAVSSHEKIESMPLVVVLRDVLKIIRNKKELQKSINEKKIQINHKEIRDTNYPVCLFDVINIPFAKKNYKALLSPKKKMIFKEISNKEAETKTFKIGNKTILSGNKVQINLIHGRNIITDEKVKTGDSIVLDLKDNKIIKIIPMEKGKNAFIIRGKHAGYIGQIKDIMARGGKQIAKIKSDEGKVNVWIKNIIVIE
jgi:small subunit ribosomal protein S4e